ncbi:MAG: arginase, partial [Bacteroidetes bacterium]|nr:arginase [Bacteroidota bacterium]
MTSFAKTFRLIGIPMDLGQQLRGVDMGPSALRYAGLAERLVSLGHQVQDAGNVGTAVRDALSGSDRAHAYLPAVLETCEAVYGAAKQALADGVHPIFMGGDHSVSLGTVSGIASQGRTGLIWVDAHGDFNTVDSSASGNVHGMPLAALTGLGDERMVNLGHEGAKVAAEHVVLVGVRDLDGPERALMQSAGVRVFTMREIDEHGMPQVIRQALAHLAPLERLHVSLDLDALDPTVAPGVGTPVPGGLSYREAHLLMEMLSDDGRVG